MPQRREREGPAGTMAMHRGVLGAVAAFLFLAVASLAGPAHAANAIVTAKEEGGYGRLVLNFPDDVPTVRAEVVGSVAIITFSEPVELDAERISAGLPSYVTVVRQDPDSRAIRLALNQAVSLNTTPAAERIYIDFLPADYAGVPPGLPQEVIDELARRAQEAERLAREAAERAAPEKAHIDVDFIQMPTFGRYIFTPDKKIDIRFERTSMGLTVTFGAPSIVEIGTLQARLPEYVADLTRMVSPEQTVLQFTLAPTVTVRDFRESEAHIADFVPPEGYRDEESVTTPAEAPPAEESKATVAAGADEAQAQPAAGQDAEEQAEPVRKIKTSEGEAEDGQDPAASPVSSPEIRAERVGDGIRLVFAFPRKTPVAVFERLQVLWVVMSTDEAVDPSPLRDVAPDLVREVQNWRAGGAAVVRLVLARPLLAAADVEERQLVVELGDQGAGRGAPITVRRAAGDNGDAVAELLLAGAGQLHQFDDPETGGELSVVTAVGPTRIMPKTQRFVDFTLWPTAHALAIERVSDGVTVSTQGPVVRISRPRGLNLSAAGGATSTLLSGREAESAARPAFIRLDPTLPPGEARDRINRQISEVAAAPEVSRNAERLGLARTYLSLDMGAEALGVLSLVEAAEKAMGEEPRMRALKGVALLQMHRPQEALDELDAFELSQSTDAHLWQGLAFTQLGKWEMALMAFEKGRPALSSYPPEHQRDLLLGQAEAALHLGEPAPASAALAQARDLGRGEERRLTFLEAWLAELGGDRNRAMAAYGLIAAEEPIRDAAGAQARLRRTVLGHEMGEIDDDEAIKRLEHLTMAWRGDETEYMASRELANLYSEKGDYRRAFELMRTSLLAGPDSPITQALQDDMSKVFQKLFLAPSTEGLSMVDALALYYDFREMTPVGRKGDEMIRALAERLISLDLLDKAADLLSYQIEHRLTGAARAQVATRLAAVHLMANRPADALKVLTSTRQSNLPPSVENERTLIEARALGDTGRTELALDLLAAMPKSDRVSRVRADILWTAERWQEAGEELERMLGERWEEGTELTARMREEVLRAGIAYSMAGDRLSTQRLRTKFLDQMASSTDAAAFDVVTQPAAAKEGAIEEVVQNLSKTDRLRDFLQEYSARGTVPSDTPES